MSLTKFFLYMIAFLAGAFLRECIEEKRDWPLFLGWSIPLIIFGISVICVELLQ